MEDCLKDPAVHRKTLLKTELLGDIQEVKGLILFRILRQCSM
jgi:hypothetical protein